jgi:hypothetical protein
VRLALSQGAYSAKSIIADAQKCINLYAEKNPQDAPFPLTHYLTPGIDRLSTGSSLSNINPVRCTYRTSGGNLYVVIGTTVYYVDPAYVFTSLGTLDAGSTPVKMQDNGDVILVADGTANLYAIDISSGPPGTFAQVTDPNTYGGTTVEVLAGYFILNVPGTYEWYVSFDQVNFDMLTGSVGTILTGSITDAGSGYTNGTYAGTSMTGGTGSGAIATIVVASNIISTVTITTPGTGYVAGDVLSASVTGGTGFTWTVATVGGNAFNPLYLATKDTYPDPIQAIIVMHAEIWLVGQLTTEIWYLYGNTNTTFPFALLPGTYNEHGTIAPYSVCKQDLSVYFLSQDEQGQSIVIKGANYQCRRISTPAIENILSKYNTVSDCIGFTYQQEGHVFLVLSFPSANATWVYDETSELWHQRCWTDSNGNLNRHRMNVGCNVYNTNVVGDWENGNLYALDLGTTVDNVDGLGPNTDGSYPISRIRSFPVVLNEDKRVNFKKFIADMQVGSSAYPSTSLPMVSLRWSDDRGKTYGNRVEQSLGDQGNYLTNMQWRRTGLSRGCVFELSWSVAGVTALNGAFCDVEMSET